MDYTIFYREELPCDGNWGNEYIWDIFISAFNSSDRVNQVYDLVKANKKHWVIQPDYCYDAADYPQGETFGPYNNNEAIFIQGYLGESGLENISNIRICIDITGFIKPYMMHLIFMLKRFGAKNIDVIYSEPDHYAKKEKTIFSDKEVYEIRQVHGFAGTHSTDQSRDLLVLGSGYDDELISQVALYKAHCRKLQIFGLPSLKPDMYQENILNANMASEEVGAGIRTATSSFFAPANDPFVVATELSKIFKRELEKNGITNAYLSPLATKPQALGFTLFYLSECQDKQISMIYPFCRSHAKETSVGISKISKYTLEFD